MAENKRFFYAVVGFGIAAESTTSFTEARGVQNMGVNTNFNLEQIFELGQLAIYDQPEGLAEVEVTAEKVLDGHPPLGILSTQGATDPSLVGRSNRICNLAMSLHTDTQSSASGNPVQQLYMSGMFLNQWNFAFQINGPFTESASWVGNNKDWRASGYNFTPSHVATGIPLAAEGVNVRQHFDRYSSRFPTDIPGVSSSGTYGTTTGVSNFVLQRITTGVNLGRGNIFELGRKAPYFRPVEFPVEVSTEFLILAKGTKADDTECFEDATNQTSNQYILLVTQEGTKIDLGVKNRKLSTQQSGAEAGQNSSNMTITYRYRNFSEMQVQHPQDPTVALRP